MNGLVLAGGYSTRMGYDKALIQYHGRPQVLYLYQLLTKFCDDVYISARQDKYHLPTLLDNPFYANMGPLAGLRTAMEYKMTTWLVVGIDYPLFQEDHLKYLIEYKTELAAVCYNPVTQFYEPFLGKYTSNFYSYMVSAMDNGIDSCQKILKTLAIDQVVLNNLSILESRNERDSIL